MTTFAGISLRARDRLDPYRNQVSGKRNEDGGDPLIFGRLR
jgi:hypothetical protein